MLRNISFHIKDRNKRRVRVPSDSAAHFLTLSLLAQRRKRKVMYKVSYPIKVYKKDISLNKSNFIESHKNFVFLSENVPVI